MDKQDAEKDSASAVTVTPSAMTCADATAASEAATAPSEPGATANAKIEPARGSCERAGDRGCGRRRAGAGCRQ